MSDAKTAKMAKPRLLYANRFQGEFRHDSIDQILPPEHPVRDVWNFVESLDLSSLLERIKSVPGNAGAAAIDPRILFALWLQATVASVGSARALADLCEEHLVYRWICGGVSVGHHVLSDFRTEHRDLLNKLLTETVAVLLHEDLIDLKRVAQDGMRVRASAGASSFRREASIEECLNEAKQQVETLSQQTDEDAGAVSRRQQAARERAAHERVERLTAAQKELKKLQAVNESQPKSRQKEPEKVRASTTDPECRKMKMPDGGFRPAFNVQFAATTDGHVIVGVDVTNEGTDGGQMPPMLDQIETRFGKRPDEMLVDGGFATVDAIDQAEQAGSKVYAPLKKEAEQLEEGKDPYSRKKSDTDASAEMRARMGTAEAKTIYKERASTAELVNAHARNRGLYAVRVRGREKVLAVVLWYALAHNFQRMLALRAGSKSET